MLTKRRILTYFFPIIFCLLYVSGCTTVPYVQPLSHSVTLDSPGIYHIVNKGETLWRISKQYGVDLEQLTKINRISDNTSIEIGQRIFIPDQLRNKTLELKYAKGDDFIWPIKGKIVCSFGRTFNNMLNKGVVITPYSGGEVVASRSGKVVFLSEKFAGLGTTLIIDHEDGFFTVYGINSDIFVKPGDAIKRGTPVGRITGSGKNAYLRFEIRKGQVPQNPIFYLP